jgi:putative acetyltransferase
MQVHAMLVSLERPDQPEVLSLIAELDTYQAALYPPESNHGIDAALSQPNVLFAVARDARGKACGCGAIVLDGKAGELKRMFVRPVHRGLGVGKALLAFLEAEALRAGCTLLMLETGIRQPEALGLYAGCGYARRGPFASYTNDPLSVFMQKQLNSPCGAPASGKSDFRQSPE